MGPLKGQLCFWGVSPFGLQAKGMELSSRPPGGSFEKDQEKWQGTEKKGGWAKTDTNKAQRRWSPAAPGKGELEGSRAETGQEHFTAPELSKPHTLHLH